MGQRRSQCEQVPQDKFAVAVASVPLLQLAALLCEGAEAGDFGEWSSDRGIQLDLSLGCFDERPGRGAVMVGCLRRV